MNVGGAALINARGNSGMLLTSELRVVTCRPNNPRCAACVAGTPRALLRALVD